MTIYADLEIVLRQRHINGYIVDLHYKSPSDEADNRLTSYKGADSLINFDFEHLRELASEPAAYGQLLGKTLFSDPSVWAAFESACTTAYNQKAVLRVRLLIDPSASELHSLYWETLREPQDGQLLFTSENIVFSRYLSSYDWRPVHLRAQSELRALVVIANPKLEIYPHLHAVDVTRELTRVQNSLGNIRSTVLASNGSANLNNIMTQLRDGYDILYVICHGSTSAGETWLWLEDEDRNVARTSGADIVARLNELRMRPRLIVLAACQSAGTGDDVRTDDKGALAALGPRLAEAGVPAVVAMQGNVTVQTVDTFMPVFFRELQSDGLIDRAMAIARGEVRNRPDWWLPTLFLRLRNGRIWSGSGEHQGFDKWPALLGQICGRCCTPILGFGLLEPLLGSTREIAQRWAETYRYPLSPDKREELPQVAQFLSVNQASSFPRTELGKYLRRALQERYGDRLSEDLRTEMASLDEIIKSIGSQCRKENPQDPHKVLANQPFSIYITTTPDDLLVDALIDLGKSPHVALCPWNEDIVRKVPKSPSDYEPSPDHPLVYYLFGRLSVPDSLVITEDDYFDYLMGVTRNKDIIPPAVRGGLADTALLFLGFQLDSWDFRVLYRSLIEQEGGGRRRRYAHVAAQIDPEGNRLIEPERARKYLETYFGFAAISIYWGSTERFLVELDQQTRRP